MRRTSGEFTRIMPPRARYGPCHEGRRESIHSLTGHFDVEGGPAGWHGNLEGGPAGWHGNLEGAPGGWHGNLRATSKFGSAVSPAPPTEEEREETELLLGDEEENTKEEKDDDLRREEEDEVMKKDTRLKVYKETCLSEWSEKHELNIDTHCIILDVGGDRFIARRSCLEKYPSTRLGKLVRASNVNTILECCDEFIPGDPPEYFFDRNPENFSAILDMYRTRMFHVSEAGCALVLQKDLEYWNIDELIMEPCCALKYYPQIEVAQNEKDGDIMAKQKEIDLAEEEDFGNTNLGQVRSLVWNTMEYPWTSKFAQFVAFFSLSMVLVSTFTFILSTMEELQISEATGTSNFPVVTDIIDVIDNFVIIFFTIEYLIRLVCSPKKFKFMKDAMNLVDIFAILPFYLSLLLEGLEDFEIIGKAGKIVRLIRVMRILRIFKLVRHFAGLQSLLYTLQQAYKELGLLILLVAVAILTFSSLVYFAEKDEAGPENCTTKARNNTKKYRKKKVVGSDNPCHSWSFMESFWWGLMTLTTVGYDLSPKTLLGKLVGGICALCGVFILTLPIPIVVNSFASYYKNRLWRNEVAAKKRERTRQQAAELKQMQKLFLLNAMAAPVGTQRPQLDLAPTQEKDKNTKKHIVFQ